MMRSSQSAALLAFLLALPVASAQTTVTGPGSFIQGGDVGVFPFGLPPPAGESSILVEEAVRNVVAVRIHGLLHPNANDIQATLIDPAGIEHNVFVPPDHYSIGNSPAFVGGSYEWVEWGAPNFYPVCTFDHTCPGPDMAPGRYNQLFDWGGSIWAGEGGIVNTPMCSIQGGPGVWKLRIYSWETLANGQFSSWSLVFNGPCRSGDEGAFCFGDGSGSACPCGNSGMPNQGCDSGTGGSNDPSGGAGLSVLGRNSIAPMEQIVIGAYNLPTSTLGVFIESANTAGTGSGVPFGAGLLCLGGQLTRLKVTSTGFSGAASLGPGFTPSGVVQPGETRYYQFVYRDAQTPCGLGLLNTTNAWAIRWY